MDKQIKDLGTTLTTLADGDVLAVDRIADGVTGKITKDNLKTTLGVITTAQANEITANTAKNTYPSADASKLANIEANADVTDTTNVTNAGALMDSEVTNLADVKAFDPADYAPALGVDDNYVTDAEKVVIGNTSGTNTGDQTSIVGITGTKAQFDTAVTDGNIMYIGDAPTSHTHTASEVTDFDTEVANNSAVTANTAKTGVTTQISNLVEDTTPQLGGNLDLNGNVITGLEIGTDVQAYSSVLAATTASFLTADETKLDGIETAAEVNTINSSTSGEPSGSDAVVNVVSLTQAEYNAGTPNSTTFYIITDA